MTTESLSLSLSLPARWILRRYAMVAALVALADFLLFDAAPFGLSLALAFAACGLLATAANPVRARTRLRIAASAVFILALLALVEDISVLSFMVAALATLLFALTMVFDDFGAWPRQVWRAIRLPFVGAFWLAGDSLRARKLSRRQGGTAWRIASLATWIAPVLLSLVFLSLFASANPLIDEWLRWIDPRWLYDLVSPARAAFWMAMASLVWPLAHLRRAHRRTKLPAALTPGAGSDLDLLFGHAAVTRSLVLFNALFAMQTSLDIAYLWGGLALPTGLTYAAYAHRGAYPLIVTALLAAAFVLLAMRPGGPADTSRLIRPLVLVWVGQNVLLVASSMFRTGLYVEAYSMTELRLAALIWMALVAVGLILIVAQIVWRKSNRWLLDANALAAAVTIYACCFVNFPAVVASYNVAHSAEMGGTGQQLDDNYLRRLGPEAIPAIDVMLARFPDRARLAEIRRLLTWKPKSADDWRAWTFRRWRLDRYLATHPHSAALPGARRPDNQ
jgi:hypothetical protein